MTDWNEKLTRNLNEVISTLKTLIAYYESKVTPRKPLRKIRWALACAVECVEKQIAKPVVVQKECYSLSKTEKRDFVMAYRCPVCNNVPMRMGAKFCEKCGQKLDWSVQSDRTEEENI